MLPPLNRIDEMNTIDKVIHHLFTTRWSGDLCNAPIEDMRKQLHKNLQNQIDGFWSGHTAYNIMVDGGFLIDSKRKYIEETNKCEGQKLTAFGELFMESYKLGLVT
jgi:hypothetical protein